MAMHVTIISPGIYTYGAMLIGGIIREAGYRVSIRRDLKAAPADTVFLSLYSTQHLLDPGIREFVKNHIEKGGACYAGGPVSAYPEMVLGELGCSGVVLGEGEKTVLQLLSGSITELERGVAYKDKKEAVILPVSEPVSVEKRPLPLIPDDIGTQNIRGANVYIETHRGCLGACTFCQVPRFFGHAIRSRDIEDILQEVRAFKKKGVSRISISGGTGSLYRSIGNQLNPSAFIDLLAGISEIVGKNNLSAPDIRADCITGDILEAIRTYTIGWIFFGIESGSDRVLNLMGKGIKISRVSDAVAECRDHGLHVAGSFIVGYPTESDDDYTLTKDFISKESLDDVFISIAEPIPGTPLARMVLKTPDEKNPAFMPTTGEYRPLGLTVGEARCFDLMQHADMYKPGLHVITDQIYDAYLTEAKKQGDDIRAVTGLLHRYYGTPG